MAQTDLFPKISLTGNLGFENEELTNFIKSPAWFLAGDLLQPLFAMGKNKAKLKAARARYEQEVYNYQKSVLSVFKEVNNAIVTIRKAKEVRMSYEKLLNAADTYLQLAQLQYINGVSGRKSDEGGRPMTAPTVSQIVNQLKGAVTKAVGCSVWLTSASAEAEVNLRV